MARKLKTEKVKHSKREIVRTQEQGTWVDVFAALDAANVRDGFAVERDMRPAEERPTLDRFFGVEKESD